MNLLSQSIHLKRLINCLKYFAHCIGINYYIFQDDLNDLLYYNHCNVIIIISQSTLLKPMISESNKKYSFFEELKIQNAFYKKFHEDNPNAFQSIQSNTKKEQRAEKTKSKSKRKRQLKVIRPQYIRKSERLNNDHQCFQLDRQPNWHEGKKKIKINSQREKKPVITSHFSPIKSNEHKRPKELLYLQIEKQPLWHPQRRQKQNSCIKISDQITIREYSQPTKPKSIDPIYEFYSSYQLPEIIQPPKLIDEIKPLKEQNPLREQKLNDEKQQQYQIRTIKVQKKNHEGNSTKKDDELQQILRQLAQSQVDEKQIQGWFPSKLQNSMLAIQKLIDDYFMFRLSMRNNSTARVADVIKYIRDINGYFFSLEILTDMMEINPKLYKIIIMDKQKYLKCPKLTLSSIQRRLLSTKIKMKNKSMKENEKYEDQV